MTKVEQWILAIFVLCFILLCAMLIALIKMYNKNRSEQLAIRQSSDFLLQIAYEDDITGLPTMPKFSAELSSLLSPALPGEYSLVMFDADNFKYINDVAGYKTGNRVLRALARSFKNAMPEGALLTRLSADNFIMLCKTYDLDHVCSYFGIFSLSDCFPEVIQLLGENYTLNFSVGIYTINDTTKELSVMMDYAAMAKKSGKDVYGLTICHYTEAMDLDLQLHNKITVIMESALQSKEFVPYFQPQFSLLDGSMEGAEVLSRWYSASLGQIFPSEFIPLFEKNGFIRKLDFYICEQACILLRHWIELGLAPPRLAVNISRITLTEDCFVERLCDICNRCGINYSMLEIELTESVLAERPEDVLLVMGRLREHGFSLSLDDFGKAYSSLSLLKDAPADILKIDRAFLSDTMNSERGKKILFCVVDMAKQLKLKTVAEGIETAEQAVTLRHIGCDVAQGFYFARPIPAAEFEQMLSHKTTVELPTETHEDIA